MKGKSYFIDPTMSFTDRKDFVVSLLCDLGFDVSERVEQTESQTFMRINDRSCSMTVGKQSGGAGRVMFKFPDLRASTDSVGLNRASIRVNCNINVQDLQDRLNMLLRKCDRMAA